MASRKTDEAPPPRTRTVVSRAAILGLHSVVQALEHTVSSLNKTVEMMQIAVFGRWDVDENKMIPGLQARFEDLHEKVGALREETLQHLEDLRKENNQRFEALQKDIAKRDAAQAKDINDRDRRNRRYIYVGLASVLIIVLRAIGVPTEKIGEFVAVGFNFLIGHLI